MQARGVTFHRRTSDQLQEQVTCNLFLVNRSRIALVQNGQNHSGPGGVGGVFLVAQRAQRQSISSQGATPQGTKEEVGLTPRESPGWGMTPSRCPLPFLIFPLGNKCPQGRAHRAFTEDVLFDLSIMKWALRHDVFFGLDRVQRLIQSYTFTKCQNQT